MDCIGKLVPVDTVVRFYAHIDRRDKRILYSIRLVTGSQSNDRRTGLMCSRDIVPVTIRAADSGSFVGDLTDWLEGLTEYCYNSPAWT